MEKPFKVGLFPMCADLLHVGHIAAIKEAKACCDYLIVALNTEPYGKNPIESVYERWAKLNELKCVDLVLPYQGREDLENVASTFAYDVRFLGQDYINRDWDGKAEEAKRGIKPYFLQREHKFSSTEMKERVLLSSLNKHIVLKIHKEF